MILRRIIEHVKKQEWTAIAIDFFIVVAGVFVGLQVSNWNEAAADRRREAAYLLRIHDDIVSLHAATVDDARDVEARNALLQIAMETFDSGDPALIAKLSNEHCSAIIRSHIFASAIVTPPTIAELMQSGDVGIIRDAELRSAFVRFGQTVEDMSQLRADLQIDRRSLGRIYPEMIKVGLRQWADSECRFGALIADQAFINDFADNLRRHTAYTNAVIVRLVALQSELHSMLDKKLGIAHEPEASS